MASTKSEEHWKKYVSGCAAAMTNVMTTYPFIKIGWRQIIADVGTYKSAHRVFDEGPFMLYRGVMPTLLHKSFNISMMFGIHSQVFFHLPHLSPLSANLVGGTTTACIQTAIMPFERVQTLLIHEKYNLVYKNMIDAFVQIYRTGGIRELYRGFSVTGWRNVTAQTFFFVYKYKLDRHTEMIEIPLLKNTAYFFEGGLLAGISYVLFYPLVALRVTMQKDVGDPKGSLEVARSMYKRSKLKAFYRGVHVSFFRAFLAGGIMNSSYEMYMILLKKIFG